MNSINEALQEKFKTLPRSPGVYFHKDKNGEMIEESYSMDEEGEEEGELDMLDNMGLNLDPELR